MRTKTLSALKSSPKREVAFIEPMECLAVPKIPEGPLWVYEVKLDGYRAVGVNPKQGKATLFSRRGLSFDRKFPDVSKALETLPRGTVIDGSLHSTTLAVLISICSRIHESRLRAFASTFSICCTRKVRTLRIFAFSNDATS